MRPFWRSVGSTPVLDLKRVLPSIAVRNGSWKTESRKFRMKNYVLDASAAIHYLTNVLVREKWMP